MPKPVLEAGGRRGGSEVLVRMLDERLLLLAKRRLHVDVDAGRSPRPAKNEVHCTSATPQSSPRGPAAPAAMHTMPLFSLLFFLLSLNFGQNLKAMATYVVLCSPSILIFLHFKCFFVLLQYQFFSF